MSSLFNYHQAFTRNLGLITEAQQHKLRNSNVAIAGMGGVGGDYLITLIRAGICNFQIADFDRFEMANFNRQYGATLSSLNHNKASWMAKLAQDINPESNINILQDGINQDNLEDFLEDADLVIDAIDLFEVELHRQLIKTAVSRNQTVLAAVPFGFGAALLAFNNKGMSFDDFFMIRSDMSYEEKFLHLALGFSPVGLHLKYMDLHHVNITEKRGPSSGAACKLCAGLIGIQALIALLYPQLLRPVPWFTHFDARLMKFKHKRLWLGNRNPLQRLKAFIAKRRFQTNDG